jgi:exopolysaccharide biosynthesis predicted pyruvyltransferase EpsI
VERVEALNTLADRIDAELRPLVAGRNVALLDYPNHSNCGDSAIWMGELHALRRVGANIVYRCETATYRREHLQALPEDTVFLLHGGGNFGEAHWKRHHEMRIKVLQDFPSRAVVQMPQSVRFSSLEVAKQFGDVAHRHGNFTLFVREQQSFDYANGVLASDVRLIPDMAFAIPPRDDTTVARTSALAVARDDSEATMSLAGVAERFAIPVTDWAPEDRIRQQSFGGVSTRLLRKVMWRTSGNMATSSFVQGVQGKLLDRFANDEVERAYGIIGDSVLVTDRLHGHVMATIIGAPSVAFDTGYGKISGIHRLWMHDIPGAHLTDSAEEACQLAIDIAAGHSRAGQ